ncbi:MFS general substrate transporter [Stemphylium lycopersici]|nr:MFS general substrate transporter [Stemphylium lycopersici]
MASTHKDIDLIPGTEIVNDDGTAKKVLVPKPSSDPRDPLNWSRRWKLMVMASQWLFTWISVTGALSIAPMFPLLGAEFHLNNNQLAMLTGITVITLGFANFIIVPLSNIFGRRAVSLVFSVLILLTWYFMGAFLGPIMAGSIAAHHGWQSFFWLETALSGVSIILVVLTFPETKYHRGNAEVASSTPRLIGSVDSNNPTQHQPEKQAIHAAIADDSERPSMDMVPTAKGRPCRAQFMPFQKPDPRWKMFIVRDTWTPIKVFFNPIILWAGLMLAGPADLVLFFNISESPILAAPPHLFKPDQVGYTNFAFAVGALIGLATAGPYSDWVAARATRKNGGVREAEMRLPALWIYMIVTMLSLILGGLAYQDQWAWGHIVVWGYGFAGLSVTTVPTICIAYAIDCYKPISGEIMVVATVCKNFIAFSYSYWVFDLAHESKDGWITPAMVIFACTMGPAIFVLPIYYGLGKRIRRWTKDSDVHRMEEVIQ